MSSSSLETFQPGSNVNISLQWTASQELPGFLRSACYVTQNTGGAWVTGVSAPAGGTDPFTQTKTNVTAFSPFTVQTQPITKPSAGIYPNPVTTILNIVTDRPSADQLTILIYNAAGQLVLEQISPVGAGINLTSINVEKLSAGTYMIKVTSKRRLRLVLTKFVKV